MTKIFRSVSAVANIPWNAFVAAFLYYVLLAAIALGGVSPSGAVVGTAYLVPVVAYVATVLIRLMTVTVQGVRAMPVRIVGLAELRLH